VPEERDRKKELGEFLRSRRERLTPAAVGFPDAGRRRTLGLRREEVAVLASVSTTWYTYLEQGRDVNASASVLNNIARVLQLTDDERRYMHLLAYGHVEPELPPDPEIQIGGMLAQMVEIAGEHPYPVYLGDFRCDLTAWNPAATEWYEDWAKFPPHERNMIHWLFTSPRARESLVDWEQDTRDIVARWRAEVVKYPQDKLLEWRISELARTSPDFVRCWESRDVSEHRSTTRNLRHPRLGTRVLRVLPVHSYYSSAPILFYHFPID
jgi:transcriptional regulator with XRE-family HTH domain